jgi:DNA polymerase III subunit epsilon
MTDIAASWTRRPIAALDTETTGTDPARSRCVEIAVLLVGPDGTETAGGYETLVDCGGEIPADAAAVHGITADRVAAEGVPSRDCLRHVVALLQRLADAGVPLVVFNARFDWPLLAAEAARVGLALPAVDLIDPMVIDRRVDRYRKGKRRLVDLAAHYDVALTGAHRARQDALAAAQVTWAIARRHPAEVAAFEPAQLHQLQIGWFAQWRDGLNAWLRGKGEPELVTGAWPG